jgi:hypothetical protein
VGWFLCHLQRRRDNPLGDVVDVGQRLLGSTKKELRLQLQHERELAVVLDGRLHLRQRGANLVALLPLEEKVAHGRFEQDEAHIRLRMGGRPAG